MYVIAQTKNTLRKFTETRLYDIKSLRHECKHERIHEYKHERIHECKHERIHECKHERIHKCEHE